MSDRPLLTADPKFGFLAYADEIRAAVEAVLASGHYILGPQVEAFEREFAAYHGDAFAVGVGNGTDALELALRAVGIGRGDRVATVANTVSATVSAIEQIGAEPVFVEIDPGTMLMSAAALEALVSQEGAAIKAVVPVHLYGSPADLLAIEEVTRRYGVKLVEDCAQSHGASLAGRKTGMWGDAAAFSFYPTKNLGGLGDGGAVLTRDPAIAEQVKLLRQYGWRERYISDLPGRNSRLDELQAAILRVKLRHLDADNGVRRKLARRYGDILRTTSLQMPQITADADPVWHQFAVRTPQRDGLRMHLGDRGIHCGVLYPVPLHRQPAYRQSELVLPATEKSCAEVLCLPLHPGIAAADVDRVCAEISGWSRP